MPGFATWAEVKAAKMNATALLRAPYLKMGSGTTAQVVQSQWNVAGLPGAGGQPVGAVTYTSATGGLTFPDLDPLRKFLLRIEIHADASFPYVTLVDRLVAFGGIAATGVGAKACVTPALPRYTSGRGVTAAIEMQSQTVTASRTVSLTYTNELGVSGRTSSSIVLPTASGAGLLDRIFYVPLQAPDLGVRSIEALNVLAETGGGTSTANVVLATNLANIGGEPTATGGATRTITAVDYLAEIPAGARIFDGATLSFWARSQAGASGSPVIQGLVEVLYH